MLQREKFTPDGVAALCGTLAQGRRKHIAAAGGVNAENAEACARAGADIIVTSAPYFAKPRDVAERLLPASD